VQGSLSLYEKASSAWMNWTQSEAVVVGRWWDQAVPRPGRGKAGLNVLLVLLLTEGLSDHLEAVEETVCTRQPRWRWLLPELSSREQHNNWVN